jgi:hypothetical protein
LGTVITTEPPKLRNVTVAISDSFELNKNII